MDKDSIYWRILPARIALAKILILNYPDAATPADLPQELVRSFDVLTEIAGAVGVKGKYASAYFDLWWKSRNSFRQKWKDG